MGFRSSVPPAMETGAPILAYGGIYVADGATPQTVNIAPAKLTAFTNASMVSRVTADPADDSVTVTEAGVYTGIFSASFSGSFNDTFEFHLRVNGIEQPEGSHRKLAAGGDVGSSTFGILPKTLAAGDVVTVWVESDADANSITIVDAQLAVFRVG